MSAELKTFYCDVQINGMLRLQTKARDAEDAIRTFITRPAELHMDVTKWDAVPECIQNLRTTPEMGDSCS